MSRRSSRQGLFWTVVFVLVGIAGLDLVRGRDSFLRSLWSGMHQTRADETRSLIDQFYHRGGRSRGGP